MSKGNNQDETPIRFYIPSARRGERIPIPINQPHWKYANLGKSKPGRLDWFVIILMLGVGIAVLISAFLTSPFPTLSFVIGLILTLITIWFLGWMFFQARKDKAEPQETQKEKKIKRPRKRKDYR